MTAATDALALLNPATPDTWSQGVLAAADLRERRAKAQQATAGDGWQAVGEWVAVGVDSCTCDADPVYGHRSGCGLEPLFQLSDEAAVEHIAAEANPAHALAAVHHWRGVVERHRKVGPSSASRWCSGCKFGNYPCPDLTEVADEARAYLGGTQ